MNQKKYISLNLQIQEHFCLASLTQIDIRNGQQKNWVKKSDRTPLLIFEQFGMLLS